MNGASNTNYSVAIACGGTGGHLFPGVAVAEELRRRDCQVSLLISPKDVDQQAVRSVSGVRIVTLPAVGLMRGGGLAFVQGFIRSYRAARTFFGESRPACVLAMGGFTSAPPVLAARRMGAATALHESNTIPGRANRWLSWVVDRAFLAFPSAGRRLRCRDRLVTGTPVRNRLRKVEAAACRVALGLDPQKPVALVMGGSQGASGVNSLLMAALPALKGLQPSLQFVHLTGSNDYDQVRAAYAGSGLRASVHSFLDGMEMALGAATVAVTRAGASTLAELAAARLPAILIPYPAATDNHQFHNAKAFESLGAARALEQKAATGETLARLLHQLVDNPDGRRAMSDALLQWDTPDASARIAEAILELARERDEGKRATPGATLSPDRHRKTPVIA